MGFNRHRGGPVLSSSSSSSHDRAGRELRTPVARPGVSRTEKNRSRRRFDVPAASSPSWTSAARRIRLWRPNPSATRLSPPTRGDRRSVNLYALWVLDAKNRERGARCGARAAAGLRPVSAGPARGPCCVVYLPRSSISLLPRDGRSNHCRPGGASTATGDARRLGARPKSPCRSSEGRCPFSGRNRFQRMLWRIAAHGTWCRSSRAVEPLNVAWLRPSWLVPPVGNRRRRGPPIRSTR